MSRGSKPGEHRGGRKKGTPNKSTKALQDLINAKYPNYDPIMQMVEVANDQTQELSVRLKCAMEVAPYIHAKRKAIEVEGEVDSTINIQVLNYANSDHST